MLLKLYRGHVIGMGHNDNHNECYNGDNIMDAWSDPVQGCMVWPCTRMDKMQQWGPQEILSEIRL